MTEQKETRTDTDEKTRTDADERAQGTPAGTKAPQVDKPVDDKVDKPVDDKVDKPAEKKRIRYSFPTVSRCPRCRTTDTVAYRTVKNIQYRRCLRAICRWSYSVRGKKV